MVNDVHFKIDFSLASRWAAIKCERSEKSRWLRRLTKLLVRAFELKKLDELSMMLGEVERRLGE